MGHMILPHFGYLFFGYLGRDTGHSGCPVGFSASEAVTKHFGEKFRSLFVAEDGAADVEGWGHILYWLRFGLEPIEIPDGVPKN